MLQTRSAKIMDRDGFDVHPYFAEGRVGIPILRIAHMCVKFVNGSAAKSLAVGTTKAPAVAKIGVRKIAWVPTIDALPSILPRTSFARFARVGTETL
jgi:hypothetical protein